MKKLVVSLFVLSSLISNAQQVDEDWKFRSVKAQFESIEVEGFPIDQDSLRIYMLEFINEFRANLGIGPLRYDSALNQGALNHAVYLADRLELTHYQTDTTSPYFTGHCPVLRTGRNPAENAAWSTYDKGDSMKDLAYQLFLQWKGSPGHKKNMLFGDEFGFGVSVSKVSALDPDFFPELWTPSQNMMAVQTFN